MRAVLGGTLLLNGPRDITVLSGFDTHIAVEKRA